MKKTIKPFSARATMMLLATLLLTLTAQTAWAQAQLPDPDNEGNVTITNEGTYDVANCTINGNLIIRADVTLNVGNLTVTGNIDSDNNSNLTLNVGEGSHLNAHRFSANALTMTGGTILANDVGANAINMTDGEITAYNFSADGEISGGTITVQNDFYAAGQGSKLTISGGTIDIKGTLYSWDLELDATNSGLSLKINTFFNDDRIHLSITGGNVTDGTNTYGSEDTESLKSYLASHSNVILTVAGSTPANNTYTVTFNANGGSGTMSPQTFTVGVAQALSTCTFTRNDHTFDGWATSQSGNVAYTDGQSVSNLASAGETFTLYAHWRENAAPVTTYTVTFNANGGEGTMTAQTFTVGVAQNLSTCNFTREGYTFDGWATTQGGAKVYDNGASVTDLASAGETTTLYAHWTPNTYTVTLNRQEGSGGTESVNATYDAAMPDITVPTREGYTFGGYFTGTNGEGTQYYSADGSSTHEWDIADDGTLLAKWTPITYTVTFNANGGQGDQMPNQTFTYDETHHLNPCGYSRNGFTFDGWATTEGGNVAYTDGQEVSNLTTTAGATITLYAHWTPIIYTVTSGMSGEWTAGTYNVTSNVTIDGGVTITGDVILNINSGCTLTINYINADQGSLTFNGPGTLSVADNIMANSFNMTGGTINVNSIYIAGSISGGAINVVNYFEAGSWTIVEGNYHYDYLTISGGTIETGTLAIVSLVIDATNSHSISIKANDYGFDYSSSLTINGTLYAGTTPLTGTLNSGISAYNGMYLRTESYSNTYTVTFNANGGSGTMSPQTFTVGVAQNLSACTFTRNDHTFDGWATTQGGDVAYTDGQSVNNLTSAGGTVTLYAHWTENAAPVTTYTVTFDGNGSTYGTMAAQTFTVGVAQNLSNCNFSRHGYTFDGWATTQDGNVEYSDGQEVTTDLASAGGTVTLYAHWTPNTYTVIFDKNGGSGNQMDNQAFTYDMAQNLRECTYTKDGYTFDGWATADDGNVVYTDKQSVSNLTAVAGSTVTLYAHWAQDRIYTEGIYSLHDTNISGDIICKGNVTLEVDGELTVGDIRIEGEGSLTIIVDNQSSINAGTIDANNLHMNGGTVTAGSINVDNFNMTGGTVSVGSLTASGGDISDGTLSITGDFHTYYNTISGGNITVGGELQINNELHLEANQATMSIYVKTYDLNTGSLSITSERGFSDGTTAYNGNSTIASPAALNGKTLKPAYKVTIEENGGSEVEDQFVAYGSTISDPGSSKTGYTATWKEGGVEYDFTAAVTEDFTLTADWTAKTYTVTLDRQDGDGGTTEVIATYDADMPAITIPTMLGYTFDGYFTETDGGGIPYYNADGTSTCKWNIDEATTLYAKWEILRFEIDDVTYEWTREMNVKVTGYNGTLSSLTIPPSVEHNGVPYNVTEIGQEAFKDNNSLVSIDLLPEAGHITVIGARAFKGCTNLSDNDNRCLPASLTTIEEEAFSGCNLTKITIPETVTSIGEGAFSDCTSLTSVTLPASVPSWGGNPFVGCNENLIIYVPEDKVDTYRSLWPDANILAVGTIPYIAADGSTAYRKYGEYTVLTGSTQGVTLGSDGETTWYVVNSDVDYERIELVGDVHLILCDGKTMTAVCRSASAIKGSSSNLTIYGQTAGTGTLQAMCGEGNGIQSNAITINGGTVNAEGGDYFDISASGNIIINGGNVSANGSPGGIEARGNITLGWINITTDRIYASSFSADGTISIADGKVFTDGSGHYFYGTIADVSTIADKTLTPVTNAVPYIDAAGNTAYCTNYTMLDNTMTDLDAGWYVVNSNVTYDEAITFYGDVNLILADGCTLNIGTDQAPVTDEGIYGENCSISIYAQSTDNSKGQLYVNSSDNGIYIWNGNVTICGGQVTTTGYCGINTDLGDVTISGGQVTANGIGDIGSGILANSSSDEGPDRGNVIISGGQVTATGKDCGIESFNDITLGWTSATDFINVSKYSGYNGTFSIADGQSFYNGSEVLGPGTVTDKTKLNGKTLRPCVLLTEGTANDYSDRTSELTTWVGQDMIAAFQRTFNVGKASTICLPFPMTSIAGGTVYGFVGVTYNNTDGWVATMQVPSTTPLTANTPYLFMPSGDSETVDVTFSGSLADVASIAAGETVANTDDGDWTFKGTYSRLQYETEESGSNPFSGKAFGFAANSMGEDEDDVKAGEFVRADDGAFIPAFRAFLKYSGSEESLQARGTRSRKTVVPEYITVRLIGKNGDVDAIGEISLSTGEVTFDPNVWYDLNGRKLAEKPTQRGIYINGNKKVVLH